MKTNSPYLTPKDFALRAGMSERTLRRKIKRGEVVYLRENGRISFHYSSLPSQEAQDIFCRERGILDKENQGPENHKISNLSPSQLKITNERFLIVQEFNAAFPLVPKKQKTVFKQAFAKSKGFHVRKLEGLVSSFKKNGYAGLVPGWTNGHRPESFSKEVKSYVKDRFLVQDGIPKVLAYEEIIERFYGGDRTKAPSLRTFINAINRWWPRSIQGLIRDYDRYLKEYDLFIRRERPETPLNVVVMDGKLLDHIVLHEGEYKRMWLYAAMDWYSYKFLSWIIVPSLSSLAVGQVVYYLLRDYGPPQKVYIDNGKEALNSYILPIFSETETEVHVAQGENPREKPIEPSWGFLTERTREYPGWVGSSPGTRPRARLKEEMRKGLIRTSEEYISYIGNKIDWRNSKTIHSTTNQTPDALFFEKFIKRSFSSAYLNYLLMDQHICHVRDSMVRIDGRDYRGAKLYRLAGEDVMVRRDPKDVTIGVVFYQDEVFDVVKEERRDGWLGPVSLENRKGASKIRRERKKYREKLLGADGLSEDVLHLETELEKERPPRKRNTRTSNPKIVSINIKNEKKAQDTARALREFEAEDLEKFQEAAGGERKNIRFSYLQELSYGKRTTNNDDF